MHSFGRIIYCHHFSRHRYPNGYLFLCTGLNCSLHRSLLLFINPIPSPYFSNHLPRPISFPLLFLLLSNQVLPAAPEGPPWLLRLPGRGSEGRRCRWPGSGRHVACCHLQENWPSLLLPGGSWSDVNLHFYTISLFSLLPPPFASFLGSRREVSAPSSSSSSDCDLGGAQLLFEPCCSPHRRPGAAYGWIGIA